MAGENDQTRWVGVRPANTDPVEPIPVTESDPVTGMIVAPAPGCDDFPVAEQDPLTQIKVEPLVAGTLFSVVTKKKAPAISDIQAIEETVQFIEIHPQVGAGNHAVSTDNVPGGKIWVITYVVAGNSDASSNIFYSIFENATEKVRINQNATAGAWVMLTAAGNLIVNEGQRLLFQHNGIADGVLCLSSLTGYQISKYV